MLRKYYTHDSILEELTKKCPSPVLISWYYYPTHLYKQLRIIHGEQLLNILTLTVVYIIKIIAPYSEKKTPAAK